MDNKLMRLPPGFRFRPTDEELVVQYLKRKALSRPLPASIIPETDLGKYDPWELPGCYGGEKYCFHLQEAKHCRIRHGTRSGYWKSTGKDKPVVASVHNETVGMKKVLVFYQGEPPYGTRTNWIMHEYRLTDSETAPYQSKITTHCNLDWVVCKIFMKKRARYRDNLRNSAADSCSSCMTDLSEEECSSREEASSKNVAR